MKFEERMVKKKSADNVSLFILVSGGRPPPKEKMNFHEPPSDPPGRLDPLGRPNRLYGSDGCPRQRTLGTFSVGRTEFKKTFLRPLAQFVVILSTGSQPYGMTVIVFIIIFKSPPMTMP